MKIQQLTKMLLADVHILLTFIMQICDFKLLGTMGLAAIMFTWRTMALTLKEKNEGPGQMVQILQKCKMQPVQVKCMF
jgi:hypothetical protein